MAKREGAGESERRGEIWTDETFKKHVTEACTREPFRAGMVEYARLPAEIVLGKLVSKVMDCRRATDGDGKERGHTLRFNPATRKLEVSRELIVGTEEQVTLKFTYKPILAETGSAAESSVQLEAQRVLGNQDVSRIVSSMSDSTALGRAARKLYVRQAGTIHSHPGESAFSSIDLAATLSRKEGLVDFLSTSDGNVHALVVTHETKWVSREEADALRAKWNEMIDRRYEAVRKNPIQALRDPEKVFAEVVAAMVRSVAKNYKLGYYVGGAGEPLTLVT